MSTESHPEPASPGEIQFDRADFAQPAGEASCGVCGRSLQGHYFEVNGIMVCEGCRYAVETAFNQRGGTRGFLKAAFAGFGAAVAGSILYYAVRELTGYEIGLISILVGWGVGKAVHWGSRGKGGWAYQSLAVFLTYMAIASTYVPAVFQEFSKPATKEKPAATATSQGGGTAAIAKPKPEEDLSAGDFMIALGAFLLLIAAIPFLAGFQNVIGLLIIAFGLWEAWKINRRTALSISGPFQVGAVPATVPAGL
jgi:hypothetical protein